MKILAIQYTGKCEDCGAELKNLPCINSYIDGYYDSGDSYIYTGKMVFEFDCPKCGVCFDYTLEKK